MIWGTPLTAVELVTLGLSGLLLGVFYIFGLPRDRVLGRAAALALTLVILVPTTNLDGDDPLRLLVPLAAASALVVGYLRRPDRPRGRGVALLLALILMTGWVSNDALNPGAQSIFITTLLVAGPLALVASAMNERERQMVARAVVALALLQVVIAIAEVTFLAEPLWGAPISPLTGDPTSPPNELLGGQAARAQGSMGHPLPMGTLLAVAVALLGRDAVRWSGKARGLATAVILLGAIPNGSRSVLLLLVVLTVLTAGGRRLTTRSVIGAIVLAVGGALALGLTFVQGQLAILANSGSYTHRLEGFGSVTRLMDRPDWTSRWFGDGFASSAALFRTGYLQTDGFAAVDNQYVLTVAESGLVGFVLLLILLVVPMFRAETWARVTVGALAVMALIFDVFAWTSTLALFAVFVPMAWATHRAAVSPEVAESPGDRVAGPVVQDPARAIRSQHKR